MNTVLRKTPLHDLHCALEAKLVDFAGWEMPLRYRTGIVTEHRQCRESAALFDVSHMGQIMISGTRVGTRLETIMPSVLSDQRLGQAKYSFLLDSDGGIVDDCIISRLTEDSFYLVVNASRRNEDMALLSRLDSVQVSEYDDRALLAVQGPRAEEILDSLIPGVASIRFMRVAEKELLGERCFVSRSGYTGEDGFEISVPAAKAEELARLILAFDFCVPAGLGARDTLRMEAGLPLYGNDIDTSTSPIEASLGWVIRERLKTGSDFPGRQVSVTQERQGSARRLVGLLLAGKAPVRRGADILCLEGNRVGTVTSGGFSPTLNAPIAMGYVTSEYATVGTSVLLSIRGKQAEASVAKLPLVKHNYKR